MPQHAAGAGMARPADGARVAIRKLAAVTAAAGIVGLLLAHAGGAPAGPAVAPVRILLGQAVWNAAQAGLLLLLLGLWQLRKTWGFRGFAGVCVLAMPFAHYVTSPGAAIWAALLLAACIRARTAPDLAISVADAPARGTPLIVKFAFLAFLCNLGSSLYNFNASRNLWPYWSDIFDAIAGYIGFTADIPAIARAFYTLGVEGIDLPAYLNTGSPASNLGALLFTIIWSVLPALYILYFLAMMQLAKYSPGRRIQQALCLFGIFHFLFLTDFVDYRFGRGFVNPLSYWCHTTEVFAWRIAILLPVYQKLTTRMWRDGNGRIGVLMHYGLAVWFVGFLGHEVLLLDIPRAYHHAVGAEFQPVRLFGLRPEALAYNGALISMVFVYGFTALALRCKRFRASPVAS